jgi:hypothetical protein
MTGVLVLLLGRLLDHSGLGGAGCTTPARRTVAQRSASGSPSPGVCGDACPAAVNPYKRSMGSRILLNVDDFAAPLIERGESR